MPSPVSNLLATHAAGEPFGDPSARTTRFVHAAAERKAESAAAKLLVGGSVAWVFELGIGHYMELLKIRKQVSTMSYAEITRDMTKHKGLAGVLDGYFPWGSIQCFVKGASFSFGHSLCRKTLRQYTQMSDFQMEVLSGGFGGGVQGVVMSPLLLLKTRVATDASFRQSGNLWQTTVASSKVGFEIAKREGAAALMKGSVIFTTKRVADWTSRFFFAEMCQSQYALAVGKSRKELSWQEKSLASLGGGALSATVTIPLDVLVATKMDAKKAGQAVKVTQIWAQQIKEHGVLGLVRYSTQGYVARVAHVALTTLLMKNVTSAVYDWFR